RDAQRRSTKKSQNAEAADSFDIFPSSDGPASAQNYLEYTNASRQMQVILATVGKLRRGAKGTHDARRRDRPPCRGVSVSMTGGVMTRATSQPTRGASINRTRTIVTHGPKKL